MQKELLYVAVWAIASSIIIVDVVYRIQATKRIARPAKVAISEIRSKNWLAELQ